MTTTTRERADDAPEVFGPYEVYERLGVGGMATVHRAKERGIEGFERIVALKRLLPHLAEDASFVRSFVREAKLASMLQHANIVQLYELGRVGHVLFISMEYIEGRDIRKLLRRARKIAGPPPVSVFLSLMIQLCEALDYAHLRADQSGEPMGLVHRDVSPSNLLVTGSGHLKVIDFGIAKAQSSHLKTQTGRIKGKLAYMAPESIRGQELDARSDIFSAGVIAHEVLTARPLFATKNEYQTLLRVQRAEIEPPSRYNSDCPPELDAVVLRALRRDPNQRWQSAAQFRDALETVRARQGVSASHKEVASWMEWAFALDAPPSTTLRRQKRGSDTFMTVSETVPSDVFSGLYGPGGVPDGSATPNAPSPAEVVSLPAVPGSEGKASAVDDDEEAAADMAWGSPEEEAATAEPVALDDIPDVSDKAGVTPAAVAGAIESRDSTSSSTGTGTGFGAGVVDTHRKSRARARAVLAIVLLAGVGAAGYAALRTTDKTASEPVIAMATLKFEVEPADSFIDVQGYDRHQGVPFKLEVEAPGTYRVEIQREGYKSFVREVEIEPSEFRTIQVALQPGGSDKASLALKSTPSGQRVVLDGEVQDQTTPAELELEPGAHVLTIVDERGSELWTHSFEAAANTQYEFHPSLLDDSPEVARRDRNDDERSERRRRRRGDSEAAPEPAASSDRVAETQASPREVAAAPPTPSEASPGLERPAIGASVTGSMLDSVAVKAPPKLPAPERSKPIMISSKKVKRKSGSLPMLSADKRDLPERTKAVLCIDTSGSISSVKIVTDMRASVRRELEDALGRWRYDPYRENGKAVPACFGIAFRTVLR
ncbi:protein kinase domain-containing protein [Haliangium sp.]|uniref:serine/threonine protein kinase n=1 Tax=Haliangium sp. TaxID=2663208 RepID=UPI003D0A342B